MHRINPSCSRNKIKAPKVTYSNPITLSWMGVSLAIIAGVLVARIRTAKGGKVLAAFLPIFYYENNSRIMVESQPLSEDMLNRFM